MWGLRITTLLAAYILLDHFLLIVQLALGLVVVFVMATVSVVVGCWCGRKRKKQYQVDAPEKGIPENDNSGEQQQLSHRVSILDERKVS